MLYLTLAFISGIPALVYQVSWTRELGLLAGSQVEGVSAVLAVFFGGLALGSWRLAPLADRTQRPLRLYAGLEGSAALLAAATPFAIRALGSLPLESDAVRLAAGAALLLPGTFLLGGTLPALLRSRPVDLAGVAARAGWLTGANTAGAVTGVLISALCIPRLGLRASVLAAAALAVAIAAAAAWLGRTRTAADGAEARAPAGRARGGLGIPPQVAAAAALAGVATLGFEVLATRAAALRLGSSLYAWMVVLALFLASLALGNGLFARSAGRAAHPRRALGRIEWLAAIALALAAVWLPPPPQLPAAGLTRGSLLRLGVAVVPGALCMGAAFPYLVRLAARDAPTLAAVFGRVSAWNIAGGVAGSLLAPFVLLPLWGPAGGMLACALVNAAIGSAFLARGASPRRREVAAAVLVSLGLAWLAVAPRVLPEALRGPAIVLAVSHGGQATAAVVRIGDRRDLILDGEREASTAGTARATEELLAALPLLLHPEPRSLLEVGFGSGITLAAVSRFPLERIDCVEIARSVLAVAPWFEPHSRFEATLADPRARIVRADGRAYLARHRAAYDVVLANTLRPWSVGASGLYSREYFERVAAALRPGGLAAQWLPVQQIQLGQLEDILRTYFAVFPEGAVYWGAENVIALGSDRPLREPDFSALPAATGAALRGLGIENAQELEARRVASAATVRGALGGAPLLSDDVPSLEARRLRRRAAGFEALAAIERLAAASAEREPAAGPLLLWLRSLRARVSGDVAQADRDERLAERSGLILAAQSHAARLIAEAGTALRDGRLREADERLRQAQKLRPFDAAARFGRAAVDAQRGQARSAEARLTLLVADEPLHAEAWNLLGVLLARRGDVAGARAAFDRALRADPFYPEALVNAGRVALGAGDRRTAEAMLARLHELGAWGALPEEVSLEASLRGVDR